MSKRLGTWRCDYGHDHAEQRPSDDTCPTYVEAVWEPGSRVESRIAALTAEADRKARQAAVERDTAILDLLREQSDGVLIFLRERRPDDPLIVEEIIRRFAGAEESE